MMKPARIVTGKPTAKILICGAARVITPNAKFTSRIDATAGIAIKQRTLKGFSNPKHRLHRQVFWDGDRTNGKQKETLDDGLNQHEMAI